MVTPHGPFVPLVLPVIANVGAPVALPELHTCVEMTIRTLLPALCPESWRSVSVVYVTPDWVIASDVKLAYCALMADAATTRSPLETPTKCSRRPIA